MEKDSVISFPVKGLDRVAVVTGTEGKQSLQVVDTFGNHLVISSKEVEFSTADYKISSKKTALVNNLADWVAESKKKSESIILKDVWELLDADGQKQVTLEAVADLLWGDLDGPGAYALWTTLKADKLYFKSKGEFWEVKAQEQVTQASKQLLAQQNKQLEQNELFTRLSSRIKDPQFPLTPEDSQKLKPLELLALYDEEAPQKNSAFEILSLLGRPKTAEAALKLLIDLKIWQKHENLDLLRLGWKQEFEQELEKQALELSHFAMDMTGRKDLRAQDVITIDDATTTEIDDGLGIQQTPEGLVYWIHIADPASLIPQDSELDTEARKRGTTVYLPDQRITMFPTSLAEGPFSLRPGQDAAALSFGCRIAEDGHLENCEILQTIIQSNKRMTYEEADAGSTSDPLLIALVQAFHLRKAWRAKQGSVDINLPEQDISLDLSKDQVEITTYKSSLFRDVVAEFMILAGEGAAQYLADNHIPALFRLQPPSDTPAPDLSLIPEGPPREFAKIVTMNRSVSSTVPGIHTGLGLPWYVQVTSPIRRYIDLALHRQIEAHLKGTSLAYTEEDWGLLAAQIDPIIGQSAKLERSQDKYWTIEFLSRKKGKIWDAQIIGYFRDDERQAQVLIPEIGFRTIVKLSKPQAIGHILHLKVASADPRKDLLNFNEA